VSRITELHDQAMELSDEAFIARRKGDSERADQLSRQAFELEAAAAELVRNSLEIEPTRSVLYRSAASMAMDIGELREAEKLIATALSGDPPPDIADELRNLLEQVQFDRHLELRGIRLDPGEFQFSIAGSEVAYGMTLSNVFIERIANIEKVIFRTVERMLDLPFRERGSATRSVQQGYSLYMATPRPGSFAVTLRLGRQMQLPGFDLSEKIVTDVVECFDLVNTGQEQHLRERIPQEAYYRNFVQLAKTIAPDGEQVNLVGMTTGSEDSEIRVRFTRTRNDIHPPPPKPEESPDTEGKPIAVRGRLMYADARRDEQLIRLVPPKGKQYQVVVPPGMMNDIVRPLWEDTVEVRGMQYGQKRKIYLSDIERVHEEDIE